MKAHVLSIILIVVSVLVLCTRTFGGTTFAWGAGLSFVVLCIVGLRSSTVREALLLTASMGLTGIYVLQGGSGETLAAALDLAAFFAAFILLLTALKIAAERSRSVLAVGRYLIQQPASGRYVATATGGHFLGVFLNFGAISLMAPLIQNAAKDDTGSVNKELERRQISALLRGFAWILLWAPTTLTQAVLLTLFTEVSYGTLIAMGIATAALMMGIGFLFDRMEWRHTAPPTKQAPTFPTADFARLSLVCATLIAATACLQIWLGYTTALALMFVAPTVTLLWFMAQRPKGMHMGTQLTVFWPALADNAPGLARSAIALGLSGFIGRMLADVLPIEALTAQVDLAGLPGWMVLAALPVLITLGGQIALSPIILVVFLGQVIQTLPNLPADPTNIVFALSAGWALSMFASPNATATLLISATTKLAPTTLTWGWNLKYGAVCYVILVAIFALLEA